MICATCGAASEPGTKFCENCGSRLAAACSNCGSPLKDNTRFCGECGTPVGQATGATPAVGGGRRADPEPVAERRLVSVMFADLVGFTPFSEGRDAEDVRDTLSRYFDLAKEVMTRHGGTIEKFIGDAVMAVWGTPTAFEDDAERSVRAALDLVSAVPGLGGGLQARAGILTGEAVVNLGATDQGMVAGDIVNTASRLQSVAAPGTVLVGEATHRAASGAIAFEPGGEQQLKGKSAPIQSWRALRVVAERGGRNRSEALEAPFVGRDPELRLLKDLFHATTRERRSRLVSITGVAGIGKSRLGWEFEKYLDGLVDDVRWHSGRSPAYGEGVTFWALGEMVRARAGLAETDDQTTTREKVAASVSEWIPDESERRWIESALLALLGAGEPPPGGRDALFAAWRTYFERIAARDVVAMVFQDLHWADAGLLDFIDHMIEWSHDLPIFIVTLARPELLEKRADWGAGKRNFTSIGLGPLAPEAMRALLAGLAPDLPSATVDAIVGRADGIPLYAVEMIRSLLADGRLVEEDGKYVAAGDLGDITIPETLHALIAARLDSLDQEDRELLQDAAVLGQSFTPTGLASIYGTPLDALEPRLRSLVRKEVLTHKVDARSPERGQYSFVQALFRDVAYNTLAKPERKSRHLAAARWFESLGEEELAGALAAHYLAAYSNAPSGPEADALAAQARIALRAAGDRAADLGSHDQATTFYDQALTVSPNQVEQVELLMRSATAASRAGRHDDAENRARKALEVEDQQGDRSGRAEITAALGRLLLDGYRTEKALALLEPAHTEFADLVDNPSFVTLSGQFARALFFSEQNRRALEVIESVLEAAEHTNLVPVIADALISKGAVLCNLGRVYEGLGAIRAGQELAEAHGLSETLLRAFANRIGYESSFDPRLAFETGRAGAATARRMGWSRPTLTSNCAPVAMRVGEWQAGLDETTRSLEHNLDYVDWCQVAGSEYIIRLSQGTADDQVLRKLEGARKLPTEDAAHLALIEVDSWRALQAGDFRRAYDCFMTMARASALNAAEALTVATRCAIWQRDSAAARSSFEMLVATGQHGPVLDLNERALRAGILALDGRPAEALPTYREVLRAFRDRGLPLDEAFTAIDMLLAIGPDEPEASKAAERAREIFEELGAKGLLGMLDGLSEVPSAAPVAQPDRDVERSSVTAA